MLCAVVLEYALDILHKGNCPNIENKNRHFNCLFDGVIYAVFASLGFAALENVLYAFSYGMETVLMRAVTSVPLPAL